MNNVVSLNGDPIAQVEGVVFKNKGEIDMMAVRTMGLSAKAEGAIGFFGTGLKYAIAILLREGQSIEIFSGLERHEFSLKKVVFRDKEFDIVCMNGVELGFTTELGKTWDMWMAYRELHCNCTDEGGTVGGAPEAGFTTIVCKGSKIEMTHEKRGEIFLFTPPHIQGDVAIHKGMSRHIYYRGVRVLDIDPSLYTYNFTGSLELTEDRTAKYHFDVKRRITSMICRSTDKDFITDILTCPEGCFENKLDFEDWLISYEPSKEFLEVAEQLHGQGTKVNKSALKLADNHKHLYVESLKVVQSVSEHDGGALTKAIAFCQGLGYPVDEYPIVIVDLGTNTLGLAKNETIYINPRAFDMGVKKLIAVLLEEYFHLKYGLLDETRDMQNFLLEKLVAIAAEGKGEVL